MLEGIAANDIIVGAYATDEGICPMLAAHRNGGRTSLIAFAQAWDRVAFRGQRKARARRATERELLILKTHLEASLLEEGAPETEVAMTQPGERCSSIRTAKATSPTWIISSAGTLCLTKSDMGVPTNAGQSAVDLMPSLPSSLFIDSVKPATAALVAE